MDLLFRLRIACNCVLVAYQYKQILLTGAGFQHLCFTHLDLLEPVASATLVSPFRVSEEQS